MPRMWRILFQLLFTASVQRSTQRLEKDSRAGNFNFIHALNIEDINNKCLPEEIPKNEHSLFEPETKNARIEVFDFALNTLYKICRWRTQE